MHILHICGDFLGTSAHSSLFRELDNLGIVQSIFVPLKETSDASRSNLELKTKGSSIYYSRRLSKKYKYLYGLKIRRLVFDIEKQIQLLNIDIIHASLLCNEGAIAYCIFKKYKIPYIVSVRNTDINGYIRKLVWRRRFFRKIAHYASRVVFISSQYPYRLENALHIVRDKRYVVIHNGLQSYYLDNLYRQGHELHKPVRVVMTGAFVKNKNHLGAINAISILNKRGYDISLRAIGNNLASYNNDRDYSETIVSISETTPWFITSEAQPKEQLVLSLRESDMFLLPSFTETFGLSYLEALSQGLPVIYTKDEGFDGTYKEGYVGYGASALDAESIANAVENVILHYNELCGNISKLDFSIYEWGEIAKKYNEMYLTIKRETKQ